MKALFFTSLILFSIAAQAQQQVVKYTEGAIAINLSVGWEPSLKSCNISYIKIKSSGKIYSSRITMGDMPCTRIINRKAEYDWYTSCASWSKAGKMQTKFKYNKKNKTLSIKNANDPKVCQFIVKLK